MPRKLRNCGHILTNGELCNAIPLRDSNFCYWHHKARARRRRHERIGGPISMEANSGLELPLLEDSNAIQVTIQEIMQAILDRRIDSKRAGLLLYSLQLASANIRNLMPVPSDSAHIVRMGDEDEQVFNDSIGDDRRDDLCPHDCRDCTEPDCPGRNAPPAAPAPAPGSEALPVAPKIPPASARLG